MTPDPISYEARKCAEELLAIIDCECETCASHNDGKIAIIQRHMDAYHESRSKELGKALKWSLEYLEDRTTISPPHREQYEEAKALLAEVKP